MDRLLLVAVEDAEGEAVAVEDAEEETCPVAMVFSLRLGSVKLALGQNLLSLAAGFYQNKLAGIKSSP